MVVGVREGCSGSGGGLAGLAVDVWRVYIDVYAFLDGRGWSWRCRVVSWV